MKIATIFNNFFIDSVKELGDTFSRREINISPIEDACKSFNLIKTNETQVNKVISSLKNSKCKDAHYLDTVFVKTHKDSLTPVITHLINLSFEGNVFPTAWKKAIVTPIFKSGDNYEVSNYRPISILPVFSKVAEKIVFEQLTSHLNTIEAGIHCMQFGFRVNHSPETATLHLIEQIKSKVDKGGFVGAIFLDLCKAFDTVNHTVLLSKLSTFKFLSEALAWVSSYLSNREQ
ncbi:MAG: reverse transcriptase domain-containing protein [Cetobacterium somerae]